MEYCSHIKSNEVVLHVAKWIKFGNFMLREKSQTWKPCIIMTPNIQSRQIHRVRKQISDCLGIEGREELGLIANGCRVSFCDDNVLELDNGDGCTT